MRKSTDIRLIEVRIQTKKDYVGTWFAGHQTFLGETSSMRSIVLIRILSLYIRCIVGSTLFVRLRYIVTLEDHGIYESGLNSRRWKNRFTPLLYFLRFPSP